MKIGIDVSQVVFRGTGVAAYTEQLVKHLLSLGEHEHYVLFGSSLRRQDLLAEFLTKLPKGETYTAKLFSFPPTALDFMWNRVHRVKVEKLVGNVDVFHTSDWTEPPAKAKKVTTIHDMIVYKMPERLPRKIVDTQKRKLAWVKKETDLILADSLSTKDDIQNYLGIDAGKIKVVHLGVDKAFYPRKIDEIKKVKTKYKIHKDYFLSVGTREPRKNLNRVIEAFKKLKSPDHILVITGNPGWGDDVKGSENIVVTGFVEQSGLAALYSGATGFLYPSLYEGFGLPILEAMSSGTLVVTSKRGSVAEIAGPAFVVDPEEVEDIRDGMKKVLDLKAKERSQKIAEGTKHARIFTWEKTARETLDAYKIVIHS